MQYARRYHPVFALNSSRATRYRRPGRLGSGGFRTYRRNRLFLFFFSLFCTELRAEFCISRSWSLARNSFQAVFCRISSFSSDFRVENNIGIDRVVISRFELADDRFQRIWPGRLQPLTDFSSLIKINKTFYRHIEDVLKRFKCYT